MERPALNVLIVEDDIVDRMACRRTFASAQEAAFTLLEADSGQHGLALAHGGRADCILLDYGLPDMSGLEFLSHLPPSAPPVMMLTGADSAMVAAEAMRRGARDYMVKDGEGRYLAQLPAAILRMLREQRLLDGKRRAEAELRKLAAHLEGVREDERKRIAQEIHDELGGLLTGINAYINVAIERAGGKADPLLTDAAGLAQDAIATVRRVITDLRPSVLDQLGLWAALEWQTEQVAHRSGLEWECRIDASASEVELDAGRSIMLFRVVQEGLTNVVRHAAAGRVAVEAGCDSGSLLLTVVDDGIGITEERLRNGASWGIIGMQERVRHFGGELQIARGGQGGTVLRVQLPLEVQP
jgi:signal transduction histidine kinase